MIEPDYTNSPVSEHRNILRFVPRQVLAHPQITIVTPVHNATEIFYETALSILQQSFQHFEWMIVDNGSSDSSVIHDLAESDGRIDVLQLGTTTTRSNARNIGIEEVSSPYIFLLDADDLIEPTTIEKSFWYLLTHPKSFFVSGLEVNFGKDPKLNTEGLHNREKFRSSNLKSVCALYRRELFNEVQFPVENNQGLEDWEFWLKAADRGYWGDSIKEFLIWNRSPITKADLIKEKAFLREAERRYPHAFLDPFPQTNGEPANGEPAGDFALPQNPIELRQPHEIVELRGEEKSVSELGISQSFVISGDITEHLEKELFLKSSDLFVLNRFLPREFFNHFRAYLKDSRVGTSPH